LLPVAHFGLLALTVPEAELERRSTSGASVELPRDSNAARAMGPRRSTARCGVAPSSATI
jgi:hypothetical protein